MIRLLVVDDHPVVRAGMVAVLGEQSDLEVVGEAANGAEALALVPRLHPDVVLMDLRMPVMDGAEATARITAEAGAPQVLVLTTYDTDADIVRAVEAGARGYLLKTAPADDMVRAVRAVAAGQPYVDPAVAIELVGPGGLDTRGLTTRELQVLGLLEHGLRSGDIASRLFISKATVRSHVRNAMDKLHAGTFTQAVAEAIRLNLLPG